MEFPSIAMVVRLFRRDDGVMDQLVEMAWRGRPQDSAERPSRLRLPLWEPRSHDPTVPVMERARFVQKEG
jgi:hypothetical protein